MVTTIDTRLEARCRQLESSDPGARLAVIVTLRAGASPQPLAAAGLEIAHVVESIGVVTGSATAAAVRAMADLPEAERIECDGEMQAL